VTPRAIITDVEGTTSSIAFVRDTLFPYSRTRLSDYVATHLKEVAPILNDVRAWAAAPAMDVRACVALLLEWHDADRKIGPLKTLQAMIWADGFVSEELKGHVYPDAVRGLRRWRSRGLPLYIYSSGSTAAQKLLFKYSDHGDLADLFSGHFDTSIGAKKEASSYRAIAHELGLEPRELLFLSDMEAELEAASQAGFTVMLLARDGCALQAAFPVARSFDEVLPERDAP
jgi:enolase-phosphatase E1